MAWTNALAPAAFTDFTKARASTLASLARARAEARGSAVPSLVLSMPTLSTGRGSTIGRPVVSRMRPRSALIVVASSTLSLVSPGSIVRGSSSARQVSFTLASVRSES